MKFLSNIRYLCQKKIKKEFECVDRKIDINDLKINQMMNNLKYEIATEIKSEYIKTPIVKSKEELLDLLINSDASLSRFGDGEYRNMIDSGPGFQKYDPKLEYRLKEIIKTKETGIIIGITDIFASLDVFTDDIVMGWRYYLGLNRKMIYSFLDMKKVYYDSLVTRPYISYKDKTGAGTYFKKFQKIWKNKSIIIVEGEGSRLGIGNNLFDNAEKIERILCPAENAFSQYNRILNICLEQDKNKLFILALGPTATVLAYDLYRQGYRALDIGHIDIEYEWFLSRTQKKIPIAGKYVCSNEVGDAHFFGRSQDEKYLNQIIKKVG